MNAMQVGSWNFIKLAFCYLLFSSSRSIFVYRGISIDKHVKLEELSILHYIDVANSGVPRPS